MASTMVALQTVTVGAGGAASISFTSIPQTYTDLIIKASPRVNNGNVEMYMTFNGNSNPVYSYIYLRSNVAVGVASGAATSQTYDVNYTNWSTTTANTFGNTEICIPNYTSSNNKSFSFDTVTENNSNDAWNQLHAGLYSNTSAITSVTFTANTGSFVQYSTFTLYGVYKDAAETTPAAPTIGTATAGSQAADVAFTPAGSGAPASSYVVTSSPGGLTATGGSSPIQIGGLTSGTAYTFTVRGQNPGGVGAASAASNSVTPYDGYESIATLYGNNSSSLIFNSIPSTYTHLQIRLTCRDTGAFTERALFMEYNGNSPSGSNSIHSIVGNGSSVTAGSATNQGRYASINQIPAASATANVFSAQIIDILDYANTNKTKVTRILSGYDANGSGKIGLDSYLFNSTAAISSILLYSNNSFTAGTVIELFGIRG